MEKDVSVSIKGIQYAEEDAQPIEIICSGHLVEEKDETVVVYEEIIPSETDDTAEMVRNTIKLQDHHVEVIKRGPQGTHLVFEKDMSHTTYYTTPFGELMVTMTTDKLDIARSEDQIDVMASYDLDINNVQISRCKVEITIRG